MLLGDPFCTFQLKRIPHRHDTEQISLNNTVEVREALERESSRDLGVTIDLKNGAKLIEPSDLKSDLSSTDLNNAGRLPPLPKKNTIWEYFLQPPISPSDVASIGPYRLLAKQGEGGMGAVFQGIDTRNDQTVAIKIVHPRIAENESTRIRFIREIRSLQLINSPHVVEVREVGEVSGLPYMVMEFLRGMSVKAHRSRFRSLPVHEIIRIAIETVIGLSEVHRCGIIHRDLKPENLWVESPSLRIKIIDFGLARNVEEEMRLTRSGACLGTPAYMSPEALGEHMDHRSDFFSLGCVLYELTTGTRPFERDGLISTLNALTKEEPKPPSELVEGIPSSLSELILTLLSKNPEGRPANCSVLSEQLATVLDSLG
jgi:serine/threonine protein kinase